MLAVSILALATVAMASPIERDTSTVSLSLSKNSNFTSIKNIVEKGRARLDAINGVSTTDTAKRSVYSGTVTNEDVSYVAEVKIGGSDYSLIVDTGSSNTWCGAESSCEPSSTGKDTGDSISVSYGSGSFSGTEYTDDVSFAGATVTSQGVGAASTATGFSGVDGIIGFGPVDLTEDTVDNQDTVPTFMNNLYSQGVISDEVLGVSFRPEDGSDEDDANGQLTLGGVDTAKYSGTLTYFDILTSGEASYYWGISVTEFYYGTTELGGADAIVDTGTTLIYIPTSAYDSFLIASGGTTDEDSGLASFTTEPTEDFYVEFGSTKYSLTPSQYLIPTAQYSYYGLNSGKYYSWISYGGSSGVDTIIGQKFLEQYYAVFDTTKSRIGFATGV